MVNSFMEYDYIGYECDIRYISQAIKLNATLLFLSANVKACRMLCSCIIYLPGGNHIVNSALRLNLTLSAPCNSYPCRLSKKMVIPDIVVCQVK